MKILKWTLGTIISLLLVFLLIGFISPEHTAKSSVLVNAAKAKSWTVFEDTSKMAVWMHGFKKIELLSGSPGARGTSYRITLEDTDGQDAQLMETITAYEKETLYSFDYYNDYVEGSIEIRFNEEGTQTRIDAINHYRGKSAFLRSMFFFMKNQIQATSDSQYEALKKLIESSPDPVQLSAEEINQ